MDPHRPRRGGHGRGVGATGRRQRFAGTVVSDVGPSFVIGKVNGTDELVRFYGDNPPDVGDRLTFEVTGPRRPGRLRSARRVRRAL